MTGAEAIEHAIMAALRDLGPSTARQVESHGSVAQACREAKLKARHRLEMMMHAGKVRSDRAYQGAVYWVEAVNMDVDRKTGALTARCSFNMMKAGGLKVVDY